MPSAISVTNFPTATPSGTYEPTITRSEYLIISEPFSFNSSREEYNSVLQKGGSGRSRLEASHGTSLSKKVTLCPFLFSSFIKPLNVVAWPLPHEEVMERPSITISKESSFI